MPFKLKVAQFPIKKSIYCIIKANGCIIKANGNRRTKTYSKICSIHGSSIRSNHIPLIKIRNVLFISCMEH